MLTFRRIPFIGIKDDLAISEWVAGAVFYFLVQIWIGTNDDTPPGHLLTHPQVEVNCTVFLRLCVQYASVLYLFPRILVVAATNDYLCLLAVLFLYSQCSKL